MIGILVQLGISWLVVWLFEKKGLSTLGILPTRKRLIDFAAYFTIMSACSASGFLMLVYFGESYRLNPMLDFKLVIDGLWWHTKSVLFEELIFRGVILYILIRRIGATKAIVISAVAFGIYHWFSHEVFGDITQMVITFVITGAMGLLHAYAYSKTFSLYVPVGAHLGWNFAQGFIFSGGPIGNGIFIADEPWRVVTVSYATYGFITLFPVVSAMLIYYFLIRRKTQALPDSGGSSDSISVR